MFDSKANISLEKSNKARLSFMSGNHVIHAVHYYEPPINADPEPVSTIEAPPEPVTDVNSPEFKVPDGMERVVDYYDEKDGIARYKLHPIAGYEPKKDGDNGDQSGVEVDEQRAKRESAEKAEADKIAAMTSDEKARYDAMSDDEKAEFIPIALEHQDTNPNIVHIGDKDFDLSKPEDAKAALEAKAEEVARESERAKSDTALAQSKETEWAKYLTTLPYLKNLGVNNEAIALGVIKAVESGEAPNVVQQLYNTANNIWMTNNLNDYLDDKKQIAEDTPDNIRAIFTQYFEARNRYNVYKDATEYVEQQQTVRQANEAVADIIQEHRGKFAGYLKEFAPVSGIPVDEWMKGTESSNVRVRDTVREIESNPKYWKDYKYYGTNNRVLLDPTVIKKEYEIRYGRLPVVTKTPVTTEKKVHGTSPTGTVETPTDGLTPRQVDAAWDDPNAFNKLRPQDKDYMARYYVESKALVKSDPTMVINENTASHIRVYYEANKPRIDATINSLNAQRRIADKK